MKPFLLLRPRLFSLRNRWLLPKKKKNDSKRDLLFLVFLVPVIGFIFTAVRSASTASQTSLVQPSVPFELMSHTLFAVLTFSACVTALSALFGSSDLERILAAPLPRPVLFTGKVTEIFWTASWITLLFFLPAFFGLLNGYHLAAGYYLKLFLLLIPFCVISVSTALSAAIIFSNIIPAARMREFLVLGAFALLFSMYSVERLFMNETSSVYHEVHVHQHASRMSPSSLLTRAVLPDEGSGDSTNAVLLLLLEAAAGLAISYGIFAYGFERAYQLSLKSLRMSRRSYLSVERLTRRLFSFLAPPIRAVFFKELRIFLRDTYQIVQLLLVLLLAYVTLFGFKMASSLEELPYPLHVWWKSFLTVANVGIGSLMAVFVASRLVVPSISAEGSSFWLVRSAPFTLHSYLKAKLVTWFIPMSVVTCTLLLTGALIANVDPHIVGVSALASFIITYGIVGLATGIGAAYVRFDFENRAQLASGYSNLVYILLGSLLVGLDLIPITILIIFRTLKVFEHPFTSLEWYSVVISSSALLVYANWTVTRISLHYGAKRLVD